MHPWSKVEENGCRRTARSCSLEPFAAYMVCPNFGADFRNFQFQLRPATKRIKHDPIRCLKARICIFSVSRQLSLIRHSHDTMKTQLVGALQERQTVQRLAKVDPAIRPRAWGQHILRPHRNSHCSFAILLARSNGTTDSSHG